MPLQWVSMMSIKVLKLIIAVYLLSICPFSVGCGVGVGDLWVGILGWDRGGGGEGDGGGGGGCGVGGSGCVHVSERDSVLLSDRCIYLCPCPRSYFSVSFCTFLLLLPLLSLSISSIYLFFSPTTYLL